MQPPDGEAAARPIADPYFGGEGPARTTCIGCGGCMVGCRYNAKNTLDKNYLYLAEKRGAKVFAETRVVDVVPLDGKRGRQRRLRGDGPVKSTAWLASSRDASPAATSCSPHRRSAPWTCFSG